MGKKTLFAWLVVVTMVATVVLMGYGAYMGVRTSVFEMPLTKIGPIGEKVEMMDAYVEELDEKWGEATEEDGEVLFDLSQAVKEMKKEATLLNAVDAAEASEKMALHLIAEASELAAAWDVETEGLDEGKQQTEDAMGQLVSGLKLLVKAVWIAFAVPAVLAVVGGLFKFDLLNLLALLLGVALTYLVHGLPLTLIVAVVLIAQLVLAHKARKARRHRRQQ